MLRHGHAEDALITSGLARREERRSSISCMARRGCVSGMAQFLRERRLAPRRAGRLRASGQLAGMLSVDLAGEARPSASTRSGDAIIRAEDVQPSSSPGPPDVSRQRGPALIAAPIPKLIACSNTRSDRPCATAAVATEGGLSTMGAALRGAARPSGSPARAGAARATAKPARCTARTGHREAELIAALVDRLALELLGGHVPGLAHDRYGAGQRLRERPADRVLDRRRRGRQRRGRARRRAP